MRNDGFRTSRRSLLRRRPGGRPLPEHFEAPLATCSAAAHAPLPWAADDLRGLRPPTLPVIGDMDFVRVGHAAEMREPIPDARPAVLPGTTHMGLMRRAALLLPLLHEFPG